MNLEICNFCKVHKPNRNKSCTVLNPEPIDTRPVVLSPHECRHFTCADGLRSARNAYNNFDEQNAVKITINDKKHNAVPFGTEDKTYFETGRLVTEDGLILTFSPRDNKYYISPQRLKY